MGFKITDYPLKTVFNDTDLMDFSTDIGGGSFQSQRLTLASLKTYLDSNLSFLSNVDLGYTASTRTVTNTGGADTVLPLFTATEAGLVPLSGGGTTNFLRADGTWAAAGGADGNGIYSSSSNVFAGATATMSNNLGLTFKSFDDVGASVNTTFKNNTGVDIAMINNFGLSLGNTAADATTDFVTAKNAIIDNDLKLGAISGSILGLAHQSNFDLSSYTLLFNSAGETTLNAKTGQLLRLSNNNVEKVVVSGTLTTIKQNTLIEGDLTINQGDLTINQGTSQSFINGTGASDTKLHIQNPATGSLSRMAFGSSSQGLIGYWGSTQAFVNSFYSDKFLISGNNTDVVLNVRSANSFYLNTDAGGLSSPSTAMEMNGSGKFGFGMSPTTYTVSINGIIRNDATLQDSKTISADFLPINVNGLVRYIALYD